MQASFCLHLLFSTFAIIHGTLKNFKFSSTIIHFTVSGFCFIAFLYTIEETRQNVKTLSYSLYQHKEKPQRKIPWGFLYQLRLLNDSSNYTVTYCTSTFTNREFSSLFDSDWSDKFDSHFDVVTRHYHFSTFW